MATIKLELHRKSILLLTSATVFLSFLILFSHQAIAGNNDGSAATKMPKKVFLILVNDTSTQDLLNADMPNLKSLMDSKAAISLLSNRTALSKSGAIFTLTTLGTGNRSNASNAAENALNSFEQLESEGGAKDVYYRRTGLRAGSSQILHIGVPKIKKENAELPYNIKIGLLGDELAGLKVARAVFGNVDSGSDDRARRREAAMIAIDSTGRIDYGDISGRINRQDLARPYGLRTDYDAIRKGINALPAGKDQFVVVETGDSTRASAYYGNISNELYEKFRDKALAEADSFIGKLADEHGFDNTTYLVISTTPPPTNKKEQLTPLIAFGEPFSKGLLGSGTTRRDGLVTLNDITATVLSIFNSDAGLPKEISGRPMRVKQSDLTFSDLDKINQKALKTDVLRPVLVLIYILLQVAAFVTSGLVLWLGSYKGSLFKTAKALLIAVLAIPVSFFLAAGLVGDLSAAYYALSVLGIVVIVSLSILVFKDILVRLLAISALTYAVILFDTFFGANLNINSILGYSPIIAGRFYGIGNQAMSILLASSLVLAISLQAMRKLEGWIADALMLLIFSVTIVVVGMPILGANTGGTVTLLIAYWATFVYYKTQKFQAMDAVKALAALAIFFVVAISGDLLLNTGSESHLTRLTSNVFSSGPYELYLTIKRKLLTNMRIFRYSSWSYLFILVMILISMLRFKPIGGLADLFKKYPAFYAAATGCFVGAVIGFLTNDSGMSIPALILSYFLPIILYLMLHENKMTKTGSD